MHKWLIRAWSVWVVAAAAGSAVGQESAVPDRSRLPCLAPLIWRWESGEFPLTMDEAFFRGPFHFREFEEEVPVPVAVPFPVADLKDDAIAQRLFDRGVALVHGFRDQEAERAFRQVLSYAPNCAMAYWGLALANGTSPERARVFASEAKKRRAAPEFSRKEWLWIEWIADFFDGNGEREETSRRRRAVRNLETLVREFPDDVHARAFLVRQVVLNETRGGMEIGSRLAIDRMTDEIQSAAPHYPLSAYRVFLWLNDRPELARPSRGRFGDPNTLPVAEQFRISAELLLARGQPERALKALQWGVRTELQWLGREGRMPEESAILPELVGEWVAILGGMGRVSDAERVASAASELTRNPYFRRNLGRREAVPDVRARAQRELLRTAIEWGLWDRVRKWTGEGSGMEAEEIDNFSDAAWVSDRLAARAVADWHLENQEAFDRGIEALETMASRLTPAMRNREAAVSEAVSRAGHLRAYADFFEGGERKPNAYGLAGITRLAQVCLETGRAEDALNLLEEDLAERPGLFAARAHASAVRFRAGKVKEAIFLMDRDFREQAGRADADLPVLAGLNEVAAVLKLPMPWRLPASESDPDSESGAVDASDSLTWESPSAPDWTLPNWKDEKVSRSDYAGKPVLLVFFLGGGCLHCVEQLTNLVPRVPKFEAAGIPIVTISTEGVELLSQTLGKERDPEKSFPFEIVSDQPLAVFKQYGVFDEYEKRALHGSFLVSPEGRILWRELSHEPFQHPDFLLKEGRRLLDLSK